MSDTIKLSGVLEKGYGLSPKLVMQDKNLSIEAKAIYAYMASFAGNGESAFPSISKACTDLNVSEKRFRRHRDRLVDKGYISIERNKNNKGKFENNVYIINHTVKTSIRTKRRDGELSSRQNDRTNNNKELNNNSSSNNNSNKDIVEIVTYLNEVANKNYRHTTRKTQSLIKARMNEGFTVDDFKKVIDIKHDEWKNDKKMQKFIRPETLFGTKFESYLNQKEKQPNNPFDYDPDRDSF